MARKRLTTMVCAATALAAIALPAATPADPRPTLPPTHACGGTPIEGHHVRVTHFAANRLLSAHGKSGCDRAHHIVVNEFLHRESCVGQHLSVCNLGQHGPHNIYFEVSCRHSYNPEEHHYHHCTNQSTGAHINISWHRKH